MLPLMKAVSIVTTGTAGMSFTANVGPLRGDFVGVHYSTLPGTSEWISSTGLIKVSGSETGIVYMSSVTSIGTGGSWYPRTDVHTDTGGVRIAGSTETAVCDYFPVPNEIITLSLFDTSTTGQDGTMYVIVKGQG